jgi:hypothetical protein
VLGSLLMDWSVPEEQEISIKDVADAIVQATGFKGEVVVSPTTRQAEHIPPLSRDPRADIAQSKADGQFRKPASNAKLVKLMKESGSEPFEFTPFQQGECDTMGCSSGERGARCTLGARCRAGLTRLFLGVGHR